VVTTWYNDIWQTLITKVCVLSQRSQPWLQVWRHNRTACVSGWKIDRTVRRVCACGGLHSEDPEMLKFHPLSHNECAFREAGTDMKKVSILFTYKSYLNEYTLSTALISCKFRQESRRARRDFCCWLRMGPMACLCKHGNETSDTKQRENWSCAYFVRQQIFEKR